MNNPRTSPEQRVPSRLARAKHAIQSKRASFSIRGADTLPGYVTSMYPDADLSTKKVMVNAIERYLRTPDGDKFGVPSPGQCKILFDGLIDD